MGAINENTQGALRKLQARRERQGLEDLRGVLSTPGGRRVVHALISTLQNHGGPIWRQGAEVHCTTALHDTGTNLERQCREAAPELFRALRHEAIEAEVEEEQVRLHASGSTTEVDDG
jgi:hypothetical protein